MQSCTITTSWLDLLLASVEVEKYKNWFNPKHCNQALCTEGKWEKIRHNLCWFDFLQCFRSLLTSSKPCAVAGLWFIATAWISKKYSCVANFREDRWFWLGKYTKCTRFECNSLQSYDRPGPRPTCTQGVHIQPFLNGGRWCGGRLFWSQGCF